MSFQAIQSQAGERDMILRQQQQSCKHIVHDQCSSGNDAFVCGYVCLHKGLSLTCGRSKSSALQVIAEQGEELNSHAVTCMPYAEATIREAMRLSPIVPAAGRVALQTFEVGGYTISKARSVMCTFVQQHGRVQLV